MKLPVFAIIFTVASVTVACDDASVDITNRPGIVFGAELHDIENSRKSESNENGYFDLCGPNDTVSVICTVENMAGKTTAGRSAPSTSITSFRAWAFVHDDASDKIFFANEPVSERGDCWMTAQPYYWPTGKGLSLSFAALAAAADDGLSIDTDGRNLTLSYTVAAQAASQPDLMLAETGPLAKPADNYVPLQFKHICTAIRFRAGQELQPGTIEKITLKGICSGGVYRNGQWGELTGNDSFSIDMPVNTTGNEVGGSDLYPAYQTFMLIPQTTGKDAALEVVFRDKISGAVRTLNASIAGHDWPAGKITTYNIGISPDFNIEFTSEPPVQDAHYEMCNTTFCISGIKADTGWTITAEASDHADVTIQAESDVNEYARQGFWLDKTMTNGVVQRQSARGSSELHGKGNVTDMDVRVFIPENTGETPREITLTIRIDGSSPGTAVRQLITQLPPMWDGNKGWERIYGDESGIFGFCYDARHVYVYNNSHGVVQANSIVRQVQELINQYGASNYANVTRYSSGVLSYRNYVAINYGELNKLNGKAESPTDGPGNTHDMFTFGGTGISRNFENALLDMRRVTDQSVKAYRQRASNDPDAVPQWIDGSEIDESQALAIVLKKNRYYLNTTSDSELTTTSPLLMADDIVWYWPANEEIQSAVEWDSSPRDDYWSSTSAEGNMAFTGGGSAAARSVVKKIRSARIRP